MTKIIGVDVDDVLLELVKKWLSLSNSDNHEDVSMSDILDWDISRYVGCGKRIFQYLTPSIYKNIEVTEGALLGISALREFGRVVFVTSNVGNIGGAKFDALNRLGFDIDKRNYFEATDKSIIATDYLVDDRVDNAKNAHGQGVLFTRPWNKSSLFTPRCNDWFSVVRYFRKESAKW